MKCILHIGTEKTGTTLIQQWLYQHVEQLSQSGIYLSPNLGGPNNVLIPACFQNRLSGWTKSKRISSLEEKDAFFKDFLPSLQTEIREACKTHDVFLITSEHLHSHLRTPEETDELAHWLRNQFESVDVHCYFRNQFDMAVSLFSTSMKGEGTLDLDAHLESMKPYSPYYNFKGVADRWKGSFGAEACKFSVFDRAAFPDGDIRKDLLSKIDPSIDLAQFDYSVREANTSLYYLQALAFRRINEEFPRFKQDNGGPNPLNTRMKQAVLDMKSLRVGKITSPKRRRIEERFAESNEIFFQENFGTANQFLTAPENDKLLAESAQDLERMGEIVDDIFHTLLPAVPTPLEGPDANYLRDIALRISESSDGSLSDALDLMKLAKRARPSGAFIVEKVDEWTKQLEEKSG